MDAFISILTFAATFFVLITVHETGHYLAGCAAGIRRQDMRLRLLGFPQHVVLRVEDRWISPFQFDDFAKAIWARLATTGRVYLFVCGGFLLETLFSVIAVTALVQFGWRSMGFVIALSSLVLYLSNLLFSLLDTWRRGTIAGDVPGLWALAKLPTAFLVIGLLAIRVCLFWHSKR